jgi:uncharacterized membrane protein YeiH
LIGAVDLPNIVIKTPEWLALLTTGVGALEGALIARQSRSAQLDVVGAFVFALFLGLGGGLARDILLGNDPVVALRTPWYLLVVVVCTGVVLLGSKYMPSTNARSTILLDAITLGLYAGIGVQYALDFKVSIVGAIIVGLFASLTGGVVVALLRKQTPQIIVSGSPYALLALAGVLTYLALAQVSGGLASFACVGIVVTLRFATLHWRIQTKTVSGKPKES